MNDMRDQDELARRAVHHSLRCDSCGHHDLPLNDNGLCPYCQPPADPLVDLLEALENDVFTDAPEKADQIANIERLIAIIRAPREP